MPNPRALFIIVTTLVLVPASSAGPLAPAPVPMRREINEASVVLFGRMENPRTKADGKDLGQTDFILHSVVKTHAIIADTKLFVIPRYIPNVEQRKVPYYVVFAHVRDGKLDFYKGFGAEPSIVEYLRSLIKLDAKKPIETLRFYLDHLENVDEKIASDAFLELSQAPPAVRAEASRGMPREKIWTWLRDPKIDYRHDTYASLLASCGQPSDADELFKMMAQEQKGAYEGFTFSILSLNPEQYFPRIKKMASNSRTAFLSRYRIQKAAKTMYEIKSLALTQRQLLELIECSLEQTDMADLAIDSLRTWKRWEYTDRIIKLPEQKGFGNRIIRNATVRFAFQSPEPAAVVFLKKLREKDPEQVEYQENWLQAEMSGSK
jgi:hypothetical protein